MSGSFLRYALFAGCAVFGLGCTDSVTPTPQTGVDTATVVSIQSFFGECEGPCQRTVTFSPALALTIEDWSDGPPLAVIEGQLTEEGVSELAEVNRTLEPLEARYGCPDCADGGGMRVLIDYGDRELDHTWEYANAPDVLFQVDTLFRHVHDALVGCESTVWVTPTAACRPFSE